MNFLPTTIILLILFVSAEKVGSDTNITRHDRINVADDLPVLPFKVFRIFPKTWKDIESLTELRSLFENDEIDFWLDSRQPGQFADVMVSPPILFKFYDFMTTHNLDYKVTVNDVQQLIYTNEIEPELNRNYQNEHKNNAAYKNKTSLGINNLDLQSFVRRLRDDATEFDNEEGKRSFENIGELRATYPFGVYTNYATMIRYMRTLDFYYPHIVKLVQIGKTHEGRSIEGVKIGYPVSNTTKRVFWIDGNIHAREWASSHTALFIINQLIAGYGKNAEITHYVNSLNFIIIPCANPDGFEYSRSSLKPQIRLWRKNRSPEQCVSSAWGGVRCCQGVDLNRNFDFHWAETGSSLNPCSNLFAGTSAFSEPEARAVADFLDAEDLRGRVDGFITLHTYAQMWIHPFSHEIHNYPHDINQVKDLGEKATDRIRKVYGTNYRVGTGADLLAPASGGSDDWAKEKLGAKYVYLVELRPQLEQSNGFILKQEELIPTAIETFEGIKVVIDGVLEKNNLQRKKNASTSIPTPKFMQRNNRFNSNNEAVRNPFSKKTSASFSTTTTTTGTTASPTNEFVERSTPTKRPAQASRPPAKLVIAAFLSQNFENSDTIGGQPLISKGPASPVVLTELKEGLLLSSMEVERTDRRDEVGNVRILLAGGQKRVSRLNVSVVSNSIAFSNDRVTSASTQNTESPSISTLTPMGITSEMEREFKVATITPENLREGPTTTVFAFQETSKIAGSTKILLDTATTTSILEIKPVTTTITTASEVVATLSSTDFTESNASRENMARLSTENLTLVDPETTDKATTTKAVDEAVAAAGLLSKMVDLVGGIGGGSSSLSETTSTSSNPLPTTSFLFRTKDAEVAEEFVLPRVKTPMPTRQFALRFLTSAPLAQLQESGLVTATVSAVAAAEKTTKPEPRVAAAPLLTAGRGRSVSEGMMLVAPLYGPNEEQSVTGLRPLRPPKHPSNGFSLETMTTTVAAGEATSDRTTVCVDRKYSCVFWIKAHYNVCKEQASFMNINCPFSCNEL